MKSILDPKFNYRPSFRTNVKQTFARIERERKIAAEAGAIEYDSWFWYLKPEALNVRRIHAAGGSRK